MLMDYEVKTLTMIFQNIRLEDYPEAIALLKKIYAEKSKIATKKPAEAEGNINANSV